MVCHLGKQKICSNFAIMQKTSKNAGYIAPKCDEFSCRRVVGDKIY